MIEGLSTAAVKKRLELYGYNELPAAKPKSIWHIALEVIKEPMFLLLISCGVLYLILGDYKEGSILLSSILVMIFITFYQYQKTETALDALKKLASPRALVIRHGIEIRVPGREVVPGDVIVFNEGDRVAADATVLEAANLTVDESMLTGESVAVSKSIQNDLADTQGLVFSGTLVVQGKGLGKVTTTGVNTQFGKIGSSLQSITQDETRLQAEMKVLIRSLFLIGAFLSVGVVAAFYFTRGNLLQSLLNGLSTAMAMLPEEFPVVLTVFLALGAWRLSKKKVLTRKPSAIETLGSATVLCSDKTGTITQNNMEIASLFNGVEFFHRDDFIKCRDHIVDLLLAADRASQNDSLDPMEKAIGATRDMLQLQTGSDAALIKEFPLSPELLAMTRVLEKSSDHSVAAYSKGAPEAVFALCEMDEQQTAENMSAVHQMAEQGYRVIAVAEASLEKRDLPETQKDFDLRFLGLIGFEDPIRPEVPQAIRECYEARIRVIMITGDFPTTAKSIGRQIGLSADGKIILGSELNALSDEELKERINDVNIFARVVPEQKLRIVRALKGNNEIVAMTGDGVNDAPALKAANIGIAMGNKGTDVAREASSLVLLDDNFTSIVSAIRLGRRIFDNLQKAMSYIIAIHVPIIGLVLLPAFFTSLPLLLMPLHIVFLELIIDPVCSIAFEAEQEEKGLMERPPRDPNEQFFGLKKILFSVGRGLLLLAMVVVVYISSIKEGHSDGEVRAIAFSSLIIGNIFLILTNLAKTRSFISAITEMNTAVMLILSSAAVLLLLIVSVPSLRQIFSFEFPGYSHFLSSIAGAALVLLILELFKYFKNQRRAELI